MNKRIPADMDAVLYHTRSVGVSDADAEAFIAGDPQAFADLHLKLLFTGLDSAMARAQLVLAVHEKHGPSRYTVQVLKAFWFDAHDMIGGFLGVEGLRAIAEQDCDIADLPAEFEAWRSQSKRKPFAGFSSVRSWALSKDAADSYRIKGRVLISKRVKREEVLLFIPQGRHLRRIDEIVLAA
jgi:hypothetical protein